jgi:hypothetical protein
MPRVFPSHFKDRTIFSEWLKENFLQVIVQLAGVTVLVLNLWLATKLAPLAESIKLAHAEISNIKEDVRSNDDWKIRVESKIDALSRYVYENIK